MGANAVAQAKKHLGKQDVYGSAGPNTFDCSGLTSVAWSAAGVNITRTSRSQYKQLLKIRTSDIRPGDLIFWANNTNNPDTIRHVAIYAGNGQMIEASRPGVPVRLTPIRWAGTMPYAGRP